MNDDEVVAAPDESRDGGLGNGVGWWYPPHRLEEARALAKLLSKVRCDSVFVIWFRGAKRLWVGHYMPQHRPSRDSIEDYWWVTPDGDASASEENAVLTSEVKQYVSQQRKERKPK